MKAKKSKKKSKGNKFNFYIYLILGLAAVVLLCLGVGIKLSTTEDGKIVFEPNLVLSEDQIPALVEDDMGEMIEIEEINGEEIPTVEEVDGGLFEDADTGVSTLEGDYEDLGWSEVYNTSSPEAFKNNTLGRCIIANNKYGAQCVSLARVFWWSYANRDVSTCGTGMAKGMMNCAEQNAGDDFIIYWSESKDEIQAGDWLVFNGGQYGHVGMALGNANNGYVALLGENQGGRTCEGGGAATNIINISLKNLIGFYRPIAYVKPVPVPTPTPEIQNDCKVRTVKKGDTLGAIMKHCLGKVKWGEEMNEYARHWYSTKLKLFETVYDGWASPTGYGLFAGDVIEYKD